MRWFGLAGLLYVFAAFGTPERAEARPEFARRERLACGYCHIQPRGGGPRNANGLRYARHEFKFPATAGSLNSFAKPKNREALVRARKLLKIDNIQAAHKELVKLQKKVPEGPARTLVTQELHTLTVRGDEILGTARLLLRKRKPKERSTGVEMLMILANEYKGVPAREKAVADLKDLKKDKNFATLLKTEAVEIKARRLLLDARTARIDKDETKAAKTVEKLKSKYPESRAAKQAAELFAPKKKSTEPKKKPAK